MSRLYHSYTLDARKIDPFVPSFPKEMESSMYLCGLSDFLLPDDKQYQSYRLGYVFAKGSVVSRTQGGRSRSLDLSIASYR